MKYRTLRSCYIISIDVVHFQSNWVNFPDVVSTVISTNLGKMCHYTFQLLRTALQNWVLQYHMSRFANVAQSFFIRRENNWFVINIVLIVLLEMTRRFRICLRICCPSWRRQIVDINNGWIFNTLKNDSKENPVNMTSWPIVLCHKIVILE